MSLIAGVITPHPNPLPMGEGVPPCALLGRSLSQGEGQGEGLQRIAVY
jgi:hypothetical protein